MKKYWVSIFLGSMSIILGAIAALFFFRTDALVRTGEHATATITQMTYKSSMKRGGVYYPVVKFKTTSGEEIEEQAAFGSDPPQYKVNDTVEVIYKKDHPKEWSLNSWWDLYFLGSIFAFFSSILALITGVILFRIIRHARRFPKYSMFRKN